MLLEGSSTRQYERAEFAKELGSVIVMIDLTIGYTAIQCMSRWCRKHGLILHLHRVRHSTYDQVLAELDRREPDSRDFIRPQRDHADIVVQFYSPSALPLEDTGAHLNVRLTLRPTIPHPDLTYLTDSAHGPESGVRLELGRDGGRPVDILDIDGTVSPKHAEILEQASWQHMPEEHPLRADQFGNYQDRTPPSIAIH